MIELTDFLYAGTNSWKSKVDFRRNDKSKAKLLQETELLNYN